MTRPPPIRSTDHTARKRSQHLPINRAPIQRVHIEIERAEAKREGVGNHVAGEGPDDFQSGSLVELGHRVGGGCQG